MTESEWLACKDPLPMLGHLGDTVSGRKFRLFACACCRQQATLHISFVALEAVSLAESFAEGEAGVEELVAMRKHPFWKDLPRWWAIEDGSVEDAAHWSAYESTRPDAEIAAEMACHMARMVPWIKASFHCPVLRDMFSNPFRPLPISPSLLTPTVTSLAQAAYDERIMPSGELDPDRLAVLSDALEEAGCDDADILNHLRGAGPHVLGCWAVDLLTGRS